MKITLTHDDVLGAVRDMLNAKRLSTPDLQEPGAYRVSVDSEGQIAIEIKDVNILIVPSLVPVQVQEVTSKRPVGRFDPEPSPPREKLNVPDRVLNEEDEPLPERVNNERSIKGLVAQSKEIVQRTPDPTKIQHKSASERFPRVLMAESIEDFGKDPEDYKDEL